MEQCKKTHLKKTKPDLGEDVLEAVRESLMLNISPVIKENTELKQKVNYTTESQSHKDHKVGAQRTLFQDSSINEESAGDLVFRFLGDDNEDGKDDGNQQHNDSEPEGLNKAVLEVELTKFKDICKVRVLDMTNSEDLHAIVEETTFDSFANDVRNHCPVLTDIIETLAVGKWSKYNKGKKNQHYKFKVALQMILALDDIKSQRTCTEFEYIYRERICHKYHNCLQWAVQSSSK